MAKLTPEERKARLEQVGFQMAMVLLEFPEMQQRVEEKKERERNQHQ